MMGSLVKEDLAVCFDEIEAPRLDRSKKYPLNEIFFGNFWCSAWD
jgi:hypothetical protein